MASRARTRSRSRRGPSYWRSQAEERFHPMTYYMRALGYDGVLHASWQQFNSGDIGNIWYPDVSSAN